MFNKQIIKNSSNHASLNGQHEASIGEKKSYLLVPVEQTDTKHDNHQTNTFQPRKFVMEVKHCNLFAPGKTNNNHVLVCCMDKTPVYT